MEEEKFATHIEVRQALMTMQKCGGAMITPFALYDLFLRVSVNEQTKYNKVVLARTRAYVFCALCNEYWLFYCYDKHPKTEFFIYEERLSKYHVLPNVWEETIEYLQQIGLISCGTKKIPPENKQVRTYKINLEVLHIFQRDVELTYEAERAKKKPF